MPSGRSSRILIASAVGNIWSLILRRRASRLTSSIAGNAPVPVPITSRRHFQGISSFIESGDAQTYRGTFWTVFSCACGCGHGLSRRHTPKVVPSMQIEPNENASKRMCTSQFSNRFVIVAAPHSGTRRNIGHQGVEASDQQGPVWSCV